ncbi:acyltransferase family protein [Kitasatospora kazusensis]
MVFLFHSSLSNPAITPYSGRTATAVGHVFSRFGGVGVSFFFVLSGFVLFWSSKPGADNGRFWSRRAVKLFPNHLVTFAAAMALYAGATTALQDWIPNVLLLQAWVPRFSAFFGVNIPSWSLSCELFFYLCFPLLARGIRKIAPGRLWLWAGLVAALVICLPAIATALIHGGPMAPNFAASVYRYWFVYVFPPVRMLEFVLGMLMARIVLTGHWINLRLKPALLIAVAGYLVALSVPPLYGLVAATVIPIALVIPAAATADLQAQSSPFRSRVMVRLGEVSFAFYLVHASVLIVGRTAMGGGHYSAPVAFGVLLLLFGISLALAWLLNVGVENPLMRRLAPSSASAQIPSQRSASAQPANEETAAV